MYVNGPHKHLDMRAAAYSEDAHNGHDFEYKLEGSSFLKTKKWRCLPSSSIAIKVDS